MTGDRHDALDRTALDLDLDEGPGHQREPTVGGLEGIGDGDDDRDHARRGVDAGLHAHDLAVPDRGLPAHGGDDPRGGPVDPGPGGNVEPGELAIRQGNTNLDGVGSIDGCEGSAGRRELTEIDRLADDDAVERQGDSGAFEIEACDVEVGSSGRELGFGLANLRFADNQTRGWFFSRVDGVPLLDERPAPRPVPVRG